MLLSVHNDAIGVRTAGVEVIHIIFAYLTSDTVSYSLYSYFHVKAFETAFVLNCAVQLSLTLNYK